MYVVIINDLVCPRCVQYVVIYIFRCLCWSFSEGFILYVQDISVEMISVSCVCLWSISLFNVCF